LTSQLPNAEKAIIQAEKITRYLLDFDHEDGKTKAAFFVRFGFDPNDWQVLEQAILQHALENPVVAQTETAFGIKYTVEGGLNCPDGRKPGVRTTWQIDKGKDVPRLITAHPD
jgi:hypothetical protein